MDKITTKQLEVYLITLLQQEHEFSQNGYDFIAYLVSMARLELENEILQLNNDSVINENEIVRIK